MLGYLRTFWEGFDWGSLLAALERLAGILLGLTVHETCHSLAAYALGDATSRRQGRSSLNPLRHIDWLGVLCMVVLGFGWAKPVPINTRGFKHPKLGMALTALAGPASNFLLALALMFAASRAAAGAALVLAEFLLTMAATNVILFVFNMIPIPPLDGSKVFFAVLPDRLYFKIIYFDRYAMVLLMALIWFGGSRFITPLISGAVNWMFRLFF